MKVKEYADFDHYERDPHRQDVDLICIVGKPNGYVCADSSPTATLADRVPSLLQRPRQRPSV